MLIGEVAKRAGISTRVLRHYDKLGLVRPSGRTLNGYRAYTDEDLRQLFQVEGLRTLGLSLAEIGAARRDGTDPTAVVDRLLVQTTERLAHERRLQQTLRQIRASAPADWGDVLETIAVMRGLSARSPSARQRVALALSQLDERNTGIVVGAALAEDDQGVAGTLHWAIAQAGDAAVPELVEALDSPDEDRRHRAVLVLEKIGTDRSRQVLAGVLGHPDRWVNDRAALAAGENGDHRAAEHLVSMVVRGCHDVEAADVLGRLANNHGAGDDVDALMAVALAAQEESPVRIRLAGALGQIRSAQALARLSQLAEDHDPQVALAADYARRIGG